MAQEFQFDRVLDTFDAVMMMHSVVTGAPLIQKGNVLDFTDYGVSYTGTGDGEAYIRPQVGATIEDYALTCTVAGGLPTRNSLGSPSMDFTASGRTIVLTATDWTTLGVVAGDFLAFSGTANNDKFGHCYRVASISTTTTTDDTVTLEATESIVDETGISATVVQYTGGAVFELEEDAAGTPTSLGFLTIGRSAVYHQDNFRIHISFDSVNFAVNDSFTWDLVASSLTTDAWTVNDLTITTADGNGNYQIDLYLEGPGISLSEEIFINVQTTFNFGSELYNFRLEAADGYVASSDFDQQPNASPSMYVSGDDAPMDCWISVTGDRIAGILEALSGNFQHWYGGYGDPLADNNQFERPLLIGGSNVSSARPGEGDAHESAYWAPATDEALTIERTDPSSLAVRWVDGSWFYVHSLDGNRAPCGQADLYLTPRGYDDTYSTTDTDGNAGALRREGEFSYRARPAFGVALAEDQYYTIPQVIVMREPDDNVLMELQGVFFIPGFGSILSRDTTVIDGDDYALFNNIDETGQGDYVAIQLTGIN